MNENPTEVITPAVDIALDVATQSAPGGELPAQIGKYPVIRKLGEGATSDVFL